MLCQLWGNMSQERRRRSLLQTDQTNFDIPHGRHDQGRWEHTAKRRNADEETEDPHLSRVEEESACDDGSGTLSSQQRLI